MDQDGYCFDNKHFCKRLFMDNSSVILASSNAAFYNKVYEEFRWFQYIVCFDHAKLIRKSNVLKTSSSSEQITYC